MRSVAASHQLSTKDNCDDGNRALYWQPMSFRLLSLFILVGLTLPARADDAQALTAWKNGPLPFSFTYSGKNSADFLGSWTKTEETVPSEGGSTHRYTFSDPATSLKLVADVRTYDKSPAIDWVLHFTNGGSQDTPIIENVKPLDWKMPAQAS